MIYRLVSANTIDQKIVERAAAKRKLEKMIIHKEKFKSGASSIATSLKTLSPTELLNLLDSKDHVGVVSAEALASGKVFTDEQMEQLLDLMVIFMSAITGALCGLRLMECDFLWTVRQGQTNPVNT